MLKGKIQIGDRLIWEPKIAKAYCNVTVVDIRAVPGDETQICLMSNTGGKFVWNDESRVREACIRAPSQVNHVCSLLDCNKEAHSWAYPEGVERSVYLCPRHLADELEAGELFIHGPITEMDNDE